MSPPTPVPNSCTFHAGDEDATAWFAQHLADALEPGTVVALVGELGAGKTRLVQGVAAAMDVDRRDVISPTFVLIREYEGRLPLYHFDAYRLRDVDEFLELGAEELFGGAGVCLVEWADRVRDVLPPDHLWIDIAATGPTRRLIRVEATGPRSRAIITRLGRRPGIRM